MPSLFSKTLGSVLLWFSETVALNPEIDPSYPQGFRVAELWRHPHMAPNIGDSCDIPVGWPASCGCVNWLYCLHFNALTLKKEPRKHWNLELGVYPDMTLCTSHIFRNPEPATGPKPKINLIFLKDKNQSVLIHKYF